MPAKDSLRKLAVAAEAHARLACAGLSPSELETQQLLKRLAGLAGARSLGEALLAASGLPLRMELDARLVQQPGVANPDLLLADGRTAVVVEVKEFAGVAKRAGQTQFDHYVRDADASYANRERAYVLLDARGRAATALPDPPRAPERWRTASYAGLADQLLTGTRMTRALRHVPWDSRLPITPEAVAVRSTARALLAVAGSVCRDQDIFQAAESLGRVRLSRAEEADLLILAVAGTRRFQPKAERAAVQLTQLLREAGHECRVRYDTDRTALPWVAEANHFSFRFGTYRGGRQLEARFEGGHRRALARAPAHPELSFAPVTDGGASGAWTARPTRRYPRLRLDEAATRALAALAVALLEAVDDEAGGRRRSGSNERR